METAGPGLRIACDIPANITEMTEKRESFTLRWLDEAYRQQLALCDRLENIADSLPARVDHRECIEAAAALGPMIRDQHHREETVFFPWLSHRPNAGQALAETLERLTREHFEDECFAEELSETLRRLGSCEPVNSEALGYMLRGFFEGMRRHIAFERDHLLAALPQDTTLTATKAKARHDGRA